MYSRYFKTGPGSPYGALRLVRSIARRSMPIGLALVLAAPVLAASPDSPEVKAMVKRGLAFLDQHAAKPTSTNGRRLGGKCLVGLAHLKNGADADHANVRAAVHDCKLAASIAAEDVGHDIYSTGLAVIFLATLDGSQYASEIETLLESLRLRQKENGSWGYPGRTTGDTSMTQYAVLSAWEAQQAGFDVPRESVERVANWLLRTQDPSGAWGYQGKDPGNFQRVGQSNIRHSLAAAGLGSTLICANLLGLSEFRQPSDLPAALVPVESEVQDEARATTKVEPGRVRSATTLGSAWLANNYQIDAGPWIHYYLYALERAMSFHELAKGRRQKSAKWYDDAVVYLAGTQREDGSWSSNCGSEVDTAFAVLFLLRSTRQSIEKRMDFSGGSLIGGRGLPRNLIDVKLRRGRVVGKQAARETEDLAAILSDPQHADYDYLIDHPEAVVEKQSKPFRADQTQRFAQLARNSRPAVRLAAVRALGYSKDARAATTLIDRLGDDDPAVGRAARDALRRLSRKFQGFELSDDPSEAEIRRAQQQWRAWVAKTRPDRTSASLK